MAKKIQTGDRVDYTATGTVANGDVIALDNSIGVAQGNAESGEVIALDLVGVYEIAGADADAISFGNQLYFDGINNNVVTIETDTVGDGSGTAYPKAGIAISEKAAAVAGSVWVKIG